MRWRIGLGLLAFVFTTKALAAAAQWDAALGPDSVADVRGNIGTNSGNGDPLADRGWNACMNWSNAPESAIVSCGRLILAIRLCDQSCYRLRSSKENLSIVLAARGSA